MGFNTAVLILNDQLVELNKPDFGDNLRTAILTATRTGGRFRGGVCLPSQHADTAQVIVISANSIKTLAFGHWGDNDEELLRKIADQLGFRISRKPKGK